jgi:hypothetical protein
LDTKIYLKKIPKENKYLFRVHNTNPSSDLQLEVPFNLNEMSMSANQPLSELLAKRLIWKSENGENFFKRYESKG